MRNFFLLVSFLICYSSFGQLSDWDWRLEVEIENKSNTDSIMPGASWFIIPGATLAADGKIKGDFSDLRVSLDCDGDSILPHWVENPGGADSVVVWVFYTDTILPSSEVSVFAFYGNSAATDVADFDAVFPNQLIFDADDDLPDAVNVDWFEVQTGVTVTGATADILYQINARRIRIDGTLNLVGLGEQTSIAATATGSGTGGDGFGGGGGGYGGDGAPGYSADPQGDPGAPGLEQGDRVLPSLDTAHAGGHGYIGTVEPLTLTPVFVPTFDGGNGGGRIFLKSSYITINELIVDGAAGTGANQSGGGIGLGTGLNGNPPNGGGGGGAGGGILVQSALFAVTGDVSADGGLGGDVPGTSEGTGGGGAGGRIKIFSAFVNTLGLATANGGQGGTLGNGVTPNNPGENGTLFIDSNTVTNVSLPRNIVETRNGVFFEDPMAPNYVECRGVEVEFTGSENYYDYEFWLNGQQVQKGPDNIYRVDTMSVDQDIYIVASTASCTNTSDTLTIDVKTGPLSSFFPAGFNLTYNMDNFSEDATSYLWDFGDGTTSTDFEPTHKYAAPDSFTVCLTAYNPGLECTSHITCQRIGVECNPPDVGFLETINGLRVDFLDFSLFTTSWFWDFGDGNTSTEKSPIHDYRDPGTYQVTCTFSNECGSASLTKSITVDCNFQADFTFNTPIPNNLEVDFENITPAAQTSVWDFGDGTTSSTSRKTSHTYTIPGSYKVCLNSISSCGPAVVCKTVAISCTKPTVDFTFTTSDTSAAFFGTYSGNVGAPAWTFGDGTTSNIQNPTHEYAEQGEYNVCLSVQNACAQSAACKLVDIDCPNPNSFFDFDTVATRYEYQFNNRSINGTKFRWELGEAVVTNDTNPSIVFRDDTTRTYRVCLTVFNNCRESHRYCEVLSIKARPIPPDEPDTTTTGIQNIDSKMLSVFPNPAKDRIEVATELDISEILLMDARGRFLTNLGSKKSIDLGGYASGMYLLELRLKNGAVAIRRFTIE